MKTDIYKAGQSEYDKNVNDNVNDIRYRGKTEGGPGSGRGFAQRGGARMYEKMAVRATAPVTIKDISARLNVSSVSVHRALSGKEGVSDQLRARVLNTAREMGYEVNYAAASLKRKTCRVAVVLPQDDDLYFAYIWKGLRSRIQELKGLNVVVDGFVCRDEADQAELLRHVADAGEHAGVITFSFTRMPDALMQMQRLIAQKVAVVVIDDEIRSPEGLYCIPVNAPTIGRVAGEFIGMITPGEGTVLVTSGRTDSDAHVQKVEAVRAHLAEQKPGLRVQVIPSTYWLPQAAESTFEAALRALRTHDIAACYALTARDNLPLAEAVEKAGAKGRIPVIGTDLNTGTSRLLREGRLLAVINQAAYMKGVAGLDVLVDRLVKGIEPPRRIDCPIDVVLHSNLSFYERSNNKSWR